jgi:hypothetical protein
MPRPTISIETMGEINDLVSQISKVPPSALDTEDKVKLVLDHARQLRNSPSMSPTTHLNR